jgi:hypothetical protein
MINTKGYATNEANKNNPNNDIHRGHLHGGHLIILSSYDHLGQVGPTSGLPN